MEKDLLQTVIKVESEIHQSLETEREKAAQWLESMRASLSEELESQKKQLEDEYAHALEKTSKECTIKAKKEIDAVNQMVEHLRHLPDEVLQDIVRGFLREILPTKPTGEDSDCQDGKS